MTPTQIQGELGVDLTPPWLVAASMRKVGMASEQPFCNNIDGLSNFGMILLVGRVEWLTEEASIYIEEKNFINAIRA